jgi:hypothetical protein
MTLITLQDIEAGDSITISYTKDGYHEAGVDCLCSTCDADQPPVRLQSGRALTPPALIVGQKRKRGGKRQRRQKKQKEDSDGVEDESDE